MTATTPSRMSVLVLFALLAISGCGEKPAGSNLSADLPLAETVNGQGVPQVLLDVLARERKLDLAVPEQRARAVLELTDYILLDQATRTESYMKDPMFAAAVEINRLQGQANAAMGKFRESAQVDDSVLKTEYQQQIAKAGKSEYDFSQLLFDNEDDALKAAGEALSKPFNEVFDAWSKRAKQARAFQRVRPAELPEALGKELSSLKSGETGKIPVHTDYGWHVIHVGAISPFVPPTFDQLKDSIRETVLSQISQKRLEKLRSDASITTPEPATPAATSESKPTEKPAN